MIIKLFSFKLMENNLNENKKIINIENTKIS